MANNIVKISDMVGEVNINVSQFYDAFDTFAYNVEKKILRGNGTTDFGLLGDDEYIDLLADLTDGVPATEKYINLINGVNYVNNSGRNTVFSGIKEMLKYFIYHDWVMQNENLNSEIGVLNSKVELSNKLNYYNLQRHASEKFNYAVSLHNNEVYDYIVNYQSQYPDWYFTKKHEKLLKGFI